MKDSKVKVTPEDIALVKAIKELDGFFKHDVKITDSLEDLVKHLEKVKEAVKGSQPSREEREAQRDEAYERMLQIAAEGKKAGNMCGWLSIPITEGENDSLATHVGLVLTNSKARDALLSSLLKVLEQLEEADD